MTKKKLRHKLLSWFLGTEIPIPVDKTSQEIGLPHLLKDDPTRLYELCRDQILQMTDYLNENLVYMRDIKNTIYFTSGTFLTIALPVVATSDYHYNQTIFYTASFALFLSFVIGILASLKEQRLEHIRLISRRENWEQAKMCILTGEMERALTILNENRSNHPARKDFWKYYWLITRKDIAIYLFFCGVIGIGISIIID